MPRNAKADRSRREVIRSRLAALRKLMRTRRVSALLLTNRQNVRHCTGFTGEDSWLLLGQTWAVLLTDGRFDEQAHLECPPQVRVFVRDGPMIPAMQKCLAGRGVRKLGIEGQDMRVALKASLEKALRKVRFVPLGGEIPALREKKEEAELGAILRAVRAAEGAFVELIGGGARKFVGRSENEIAAELEYLMRLAGAERASFETIVAVGPHSAMAHYRPGATRIRAGQAVLIDWGAMVDGYCSDLTRVVFVGKIPPRFKAMYEAVLAAQAAGIAAVRPGVTGESADAAAREVIAAAGFGKAFTHGLGHGVGLEVHESPRLGKGNKEKLEAGMVVTVEPGVYLPGVGGVRIEDDVLVGPPKAARRLSSLTADLDKMVLE